MMEQINCPYTIGQRVVCEVERVLAYGVFVCVRGGIRGYIRRRELSWSRDAEPRNMMHEGDCIEAIVLKLPNSGSMMELSLRATLPDPWESFVSACRVGDIVAGTVKQLMPHGIYVEIQPGISGYIPLNHLATWDVGRSENLLWHGDNIEAVVTRIDGTTHRLTLSIRLRMKQSSINVPSNAPSGAGHIVTDNLTQIEPELETKQQASAQNQRFVPSASKPIGSILVVDDEISEPLVAWLHRHGYEADAVKTSEAAIEKIRQRTYRVCLIDIELPGMDGLTLIRQIRAEGSTTQIAVMSVAERLGENVSQIEELGIAEVFVKPLDIEEIERLLVNIEQGKAPTYWRLMATLHRSTEPEPFQDFVAAAYSRASLIERLGRGLAQFIETTRAEVAIIFHMDLISQTITISAQAGIVRLPDDVLYALDGSPVRDVIYELQPVFENRVSSQAHVQKRFRKLLDLLSFESCIGVPMEIQGAVQHALFLFHRNQDTFSHYRLRDARAAAMLFATLMERDLFNQHVQSVGKFLLSGQLAAGFGHEVANETSGLEIQLRNLQTDCQLLGEQVAGFRERAEFKDVRQAINGLLAMAGNLRGTIDLFQSLVRPEDESTVDVNVVLRTLGTLLQPIAHRNKVRVAWTVDPELPYALGSSIRLQQIFLNIMLNAIQHMAAKSQEWDTLEIITSFIPDDYKHPIKVRFVDRGPGIHKQLWEKIFDMGFSSRTSGSGLGLFIARSLVTSLGGKIAVERSVVPLGTTFLVELRMSLPEEQAR
jgi:signal transduction histidine kinase/predicted RNA-binding protein with RPS1 domain/DNA-binding NarL/FixJ family response regulator